MKKTWVVAIFVKAEHHQFCYLRHLPKTNKQTNKKKWSTTSNDIRKFLTLYSRKLSREKTFVILRFCGYKRNLGHGILQHGKSEQSAKFSRRKLYFHKFAQVFSLESFPLYDTNYCCSMQWCQYMDNLKQVVYNVVDELAYILRTLSLPPLATLSPSGLQSTENT